MVLPRVLLDLWYILSCVPCYRFSLSSCWVLDHTVVPYLFLFKLQYICFFCTRLSEWMSLVMWLQCVLDFTAVYTMQYEHVYECRAIEYMYVIFYCTGHIRKVSADIERTNKGVLYWTSSVAAVVSVFGIVYYCILNSRYVQYWIVIAQIYFPKV